MYEIQDVHYNVLEGRRLADERGLLLRAEEEALMDEADGESNYYIERVSMGGGY